MQVAKVNVEPGVIPVDYHCRCKFCTRAIGELRPPGGGYYSRLDRKEYYHESERGKGGHLAKTPLHVARWAIQEYTEPGDWVLDPTVGAGTTAVEALIQERNVAGCELQYKDVLMANVKKHLAPGRKALIHVGDARGIGVFLGQAAQKFKLIVNNPPYSGDKTDTLKDNPMRGQYQYDANLPNLAFLREGQEYWDTMRDIYSKCVEYLLPGGAFVTGIKDQMRSKKPDMLHEKFCILLEGIGLQFEGTAFLKHYPGTLHLHTYGKKYGVEPPLYQTISVFRKA